VPRFIDKCPPGPAPPVRYDGLLATAGLPEPELPAPGAGPFVAIAVGNTNDGESLPAKPTFHTNQRIFGRCGKTISPSLEKPVPLQVLC
jgi:hypothetical protein